MPEASKIGPGDERRVARETPLGGVTAPIFSGLLALALVAAALPSFAGETGTAAAPLVRARATFVALQQGTLDRTTLTPDLDAELTESLRADMTAKIAPYGPPVEFVIRSSSDVDGVATYVLRVRWANASVDYVFGLDDATKKIAKLYFRPGPG
jgi:hypothetical protein